MKSAGALLLILALMAACTGDASDEVASPSLPVTPQSTASTTTPGNISVVAATATSAPAAAPTSEPAASSTIALAATATPPPAATPVGTPTASPIPAPSTAREVLVAASTAMANVQSGSFRYEFDGSVVGEAPDWAPSKYGYVRHGDFQAPDRSRYSVEVSFGPLTIKHDEIAIGDHRYVMSEPGGEWRYEPLLAESRPREDRIGGIDLELPDDVMGLFTLMGMDVLEGVPVYYVSGEMSDAAVKRMLGEELSEHENENALVEMWIGAEDNLLRKLQAQQVSWLQELEAEIDHTTVVALSDFAKAVDIQPPKTSSYTQDDDHGADPGTATQVRVGQTVEGTISGENDSDYFSFQADEGSGYLIRITSGSLQDPDLYVQSNLVLVATGLATQDPNVREASWVASNSGTNVIVVQSRYYDTGTYTLSLTEIDATQITFDHPPNEENATPLEVGGSVEARFDSDFDVDMFTFMAEEGGAYYIELVPREAGEISMLAYHDRGNPDLDNFVDGRDGGAASLQYFASSAGQHFIYVAGEQMAQAYTLTLADLDPGQLSIDHGNEITSATRLAVGESVTGNVDSEEDIDYFSFLADEGESYWIDLTPSVDAKVGFSVHDINFAEVHTGTRGILWTAPDTRQYYVMVAAVSETGSYTLEVTRKTE